MASSTRSWASSTVVVSLFFPAICLTICARNLRDFTPPLWRKAVREFCERFSLRVIHRIHGSPLRTGLRRVEDLEKAVFPGVNASSRQTSVQPPHLLSARDLLAVKSILQNSGETSFFIAQGCARAHFALNQETKVLKLGASQFTPIAALFASRKAKATARVIFVESKATVDPSRFTISFMRKELERC